MELRRALAESLGMQASVQQKQPHVVMNVQVAHGWLLRDALPAAQHSAT
jgi:hypothetical protein